MATVASVEVDFIANIAKYTESMAKSAEIASSTADKIGESFKQVGEALALGEAFNLISEGFSKIVEASEEAETAMAKVTQALQSTGDTSGETKEGIESLAASLSTLTGASQTSIEGIEGVLLRFTNLHQDNAPKATKAVLDLSAAMGIDTHAAAMKLGRAMEDPVKGFNTLARSGIALDPSLKGVIQGMVAMGDIAGAQKVLLDAISTAVGGTAAALRNTLSGALKATNSDFEKLTETIGLPSGFRGAVEFVDEAIVELTGVIKEAQNPTTDLGKEMQGFGKQATDAFGTAIETVRNLANVFIGDFAFIAEGLFHAGEAFKTFAETYFIGFKIMEVELASITKGFGDFFHYLGGFNQAAEAEMKRGDIHDYLGDWFKPLADGIDTVEQHVKQKLDAIKAEAAKAKPQGIGDDGDGVDAKQAKKAAEELQKEQTAIEGVLSAFAKKNEELKLQADGEQKYTALVEAEQKIQDQGNVTSQERIAATNKLMTMEAERLKIEQQISVNNEGKKLDELLKSMTAANEKAQEKLEGQKKLNPLLEAEANIRRIIGNDLDKNVEKQNEILAAAEKQAQIQKDQQYQDAGKALDDILARQQESLEDDQLKLQGLGDQIPLLKEIDEINKNINATDEQKQDAINRAKELWNQEQLVNEQLKDQQQVLDDVTKSTGSLQDKQEMLNRALADGSITGQQYADTLQKIDEEHKKASDSGDKLGKTLASGIGSEMDKIITGQETAAQGFKNMAKELEKFALQALILKPLESMLTNIGNALTGKGGGQSGQGGQGGGQSSPGLGVPGGFAPGMPLGQGSQNGLSSLLGDLVNALFGSGKSSTGGNGSGVGVSGTGNGGLIGEALSAILGGLLKGGKATGGPMNAGSMYLVGEQGPELMIPGESGNLLNANLTASAMGLGSGLSQTNGFGQNAPGLNANTTLSPELEQQVNQIILAGQRVKFAQDAAALPDGSPYKATLDQEAQWGYNPMRSDGQAYNAYGGAENVLPEGAGYAYVAQMASLAGMQVPPMLAEALQAADGYERNNPVGGALSGGGGGFADGGDNGGGGFSSGGLISSDSPTPASLAPGGLFGDDISSSSAFPNYQGGGQSTVQQFGGDSGNGIDSAFGSGYQGQVGPTGSGSFIDDTSAYDAADAAANARLSAQTGSGATLSGMSDYTPEFGNYLPASAYGGISPGSPTMQDQVNAGATYGSAGNLLGYGSTNGILAAPVGEPVGISLRNDVFDQDNAPQLQSTQSAYIPYTQQSQIDNSGITAGQISAILGQLPGRADGGPVEAGQTYQVAERGTGEFFTPSTNGSITPADPSMLQPKITINNQHPNVAPQNIEVTTQGNNVAITITKMIANNIANSGTIASTMANRFGVLPLAARRS